MGHFGATVAMYLATMTNPLQSVAGEGMELTKEQPNKDLPADLVIRGGESWAARDCSPALFRTVHRRTDHPSEWGDPLHAMELPSA